MAQVTLHYFDAYGRAESMRLVLKHAGVEFVDHRMTHEQWAEYKQQGTCEFGQVPSLEIDGHHLVQSASIMRYLCKKYGFVGGSAHEDYLADSTCELHNDIIQAYIRAMSENSVDTFKTTFMQGKLQLLQKRFVEHGGQFFVGNHITIADFYMLEFLYDYYMRPSKRESDLPGLTLYAPRLIEYVESLLKQSANLQAYLNSRPELPF